MQINIDFSSTWLAVIVVLFVALLSIQLALILGNKSLPYPRKGIRLGLNLFLFLSLILLLLQPYFYRQYDPQSLIVYEADIPRDFINNLQDSLGIDKSISINEYEGNIDEIYLVGQDFDPVQLAKLQRATITRIPYYERNELIDIRWKGLVRGGETQTIRGLLHAEDEAMVSLYYGEELIDSALVTPSQNNFLFNIRAKAIGRNHFTLAIDGEPLGQLRFYGMEDQPIHYLMRFSYPDMETRRLSEWLGSRGEGIKTNIQYSTGIQQRATTFGQQDTVQFFITEPSFANSAEIKEALASGASILFTNLGAPDRDLLQINRALGTDFSVNRATQEGNRTIEGALTSLPYTFLTQANQWELLDNAVAYQKVGQSKIGISLLEATFPLALEGDSIAYASVWDKILSAMRPAEGTAFQVDHPVFKGIATEKWTINTPSTIENILQTGQDSIYLTRSQVNPYTYTGKWTPGQEGWLSFADSLEIYVYGSEDEFASIRNTRLLSHFLQYQKERPEQTHAHSYRVDISDWWWFGLAVIAAAMVWMEPRIR